MTQLGWFGSSRSAAGDQGHLGWVSTTRPTAATPTEAAADVSRGTTPVLEDLRVVPNEDLSPREVDGPQDAEVDVPRETKADVPRETAPAPIFTGVPAPTGEQSRGETIDVPRETPPPAPVLTAVEEPDDDVVDDDLGTVPRETSRSAVVERFPLPTETRVMTIANQKGGVGKTTTAVNIASALAAAGLKVLVLDLDPQGNASTALGIEHHADVPGVYEVLVEGKPLADVVQRCEEAPDLWCAPATVDLAGAEIELVSMVARESRLQRAVAKYLKGLERAGERRVDYVLIDCPPSLGLLTINAFVAAPEVLIPIQCEYYALEGLSQLLANIELIQEHLNPDLSVTTILLTMYDGRTRLAAQVVDEVRQHFGPQVLRSLIPRSVRISEAPSHGQTVMAYDPMSSGALAYLEAAREIAQRGVHETPEPARDAAVGAPPDVADPWARWTGGTVARRGFASKEGGA
ncbi:ParA family protein [Kineococcus radiotolerans]|uniref:ParA family protein n=1 Tax=Kineococcus radiotolerans TaxID=131568 RepID=UPI00161C9B6C